MIINSESEPLFIQAATLVRSFEGRGPRFIMLREMRFAPGSMVLASYADRLCLALWRHAANIDKVMDKVSRAFGIGYLVEDSAAVCEAGRQLEEYFSGTRQRFDVSLALASSDFAGNVLRATASIAYGATSTYGAIAAAIGSPTASRGVGMALAANPLNIFIPCHRIVASSGPGGYAGGASLKESLLALEAGEARRRWIPTRR